jgi:hypothetical protein
LRHTFVYFFYYNKTLFQYYHYKSGLDSYRNPCHDEPLPLLAYALDKSGAKVRQRARIIIINCKSYLCLQEPSGLYQFTIGPLYLTLVFTICPNRISPLPLPSTLPGAKAAMSFSNVPCTGNKVAKAKAGKNNSIEGG